ncbi:unnamed protein product [Rhizophagus irregularis]|nr:unnamed protein product [Rhizophagus irregularis]CAB5329118.1 unnamed protein product [Rhizophagus irregularis]
MGLCSPESKELESTKNALNILNHYKLMFLVKMNGRHSSHQNSILYSNFQACQRESETTWTISRKTSLHFIF